MNNPAHKVIACLDASGSALAATVVDWAAWSAMRLGAPLVLLHVLDRHPERAQVADYSGAIGLDAQSSLLQELGDLDQQRSKLAREAGRQMLAGAHQYAADAGATQAETLLRHGDLVGNLQEMQADTRLLVLGLQRHGADEAPGSLAHRVEQVVRSVDRPVLVAQGESFAAPTRCLLAWDGSKTANRMVDRVAASPLLAGLPLHLVRAGDATPEAMAELEAARQKLAQAGFDCSAEMVTGDPDDMLPAAVQSFGAELMVMGAHGQSRIRRWLIGGSTAHLLRVSPVPVLILR